MGEFTERAIKRKELIETEFKNIKSIEQKSCVLLVGIFNCLQDIVEQAEENNKLLIENNQLLADIYKDKI